jgi:hypothetical protein
VEVKVADNVEERSIVPTRPGTYAYRPVDVTSAFHRGHLYYAVDTMVYQAATTDEKGKAKPGGLHRKVMLVRSDRTQHNVLRHPVPEGVPQNQAVLGLSDGTIITKEPQPPQFSTWQYESIREYLENTGEVRSLHELVRDIEQYLRSAVWLPNADDYAMLALAVPITYCQAIFQAVPLFHAVGPAGTGKSQTGIAMKELCANADLIGAVSAASLARRIDQSRGFVVLDDLESVGAKSSKGSDAALFTELLQALKLSYSQETARKVITNMKENRLEELNFFGVKLITNTAGVDHILGSRMLGIQTKKLTRETLDAMGGRLPDPPATPPQRLRQQLHRWAFESVSQIAEAYKRLASRLDRDEEIAAPLRVMAELAGDQALAGRLEAALKRNFTTREVEEEPVTVLLNIIEELICEGYQHLNSMHLSMEMTMAMDPLYGQESTTQIQEWRRPEWITAQLKGRLVIEGRESRQRIGKANLRFYAIRPEYREEVLAAKEEEPLVVERTRFCAFSFKGKAQDCCAACPFLSQKCTIRSANFPEDQVKNQPAYPSRN